VELRWAGGLELEPPLVALEPGQVDRGPRILEFGAADGGWRVTVEGLSGSTATLRFRGDTPGRAEGATLRGAPGVTEATVSLPPSADRFSRAEIRLRRP
jgi:hypothetical protein